MGNKIIVSPEHIDIANNVAMQAAKSTVLLLTVKSLNGSEPPAANSSSVLITVNNRYFLITAAHNVHDFDLSRLGVMIGNDFATIGGTLMYWEPNDSNSYDPKKLDFAIYELNTETVGFLSQKYIFLPSKMIDILSRELNITRYLVFGYPVRKTKMDYLNRQLNPFPLVLPTIGEPDQTYLKYKIDKNKTLIVSAKQKKVLRSENGLIEKLPKLFGISGCGIWLVGKTINGSPECKLSAILTGENAEKSILFSTRMRIVLGKIANN